MTTTTETLRSSVTPDGQRVLLEFDATRGTYRIATRWTWLSEFPTLAEAADVFEALEFCEGDLRHAARVLKAEASRLPRQMSKAMDPNALSRTWELINCLEKRLAGLRPMICGSKGSVTVWKPA